MAEAQPALRRELRLWDLVLLNISAVVGVRWIAAAGHAGPGSLTLWLLAALFLFIPSALVIASLSRRFPEDGGMYVWTKHAFGDWHGFLCAWMYFLSVLLFFPALLLAGVSMSAYVLGPDAIRLAESRSFSIPLSIAVLWIVCFLNLRGLRIGKWTGIVGGSSVYLIAVLLAVFALVIALRSGSVTKFNLMPKGDWESLNFWSQIAFAFTGLELGAILNGEIRNARRTVPRAAWISSIACFLFYAAGTSALLILLTPNEISPLSGLAQAGHVTGAKLGFVWLSPIFAALLSLGSFGQLGTYVAGSSRLPFAIGLDRYLPPAFGRLHPRWHSPYVAILVQAAAATVFLVMAQWGETLRAAYQVLVDMCIIATFIPEMYIFACGYKFGNRIAGLLGLIVSAFALILSVIPPVEISSVWAFELKVIGGCVVLGWIGRLIFMRNRPAAV